MAGLPKTYTPRDVEGAIYERWLAADVFAPDGAGSTADPALPPFTIIQPPPNVTGSLHLGHAQRTAVEDLLIRHALMRGHPTLFLPGRLPDPTAPIPAVTASAERYAMFASVNPFRIPPPPPEAPPPIAPVVQTAQAPAFDYQQWSVTGVASGNGQKEVWLLNTNTREARTLAVGQSIHDAALIAVRDERAEFQIGEERFAVQIGGNLGDRHPIGQ